MALNRQPYGASGGAFRTIVRPDQVRISLFCFAHGGGGAASFHPWAGSTPDDIALYAYTPPGRGPRLREQSHTRLVDAATEAADAILFGDGADAVAGGYALFGHSVGALLAFETARVLEARGAPAPSVVALSGHASPDLARAAEPMARLEDDALFAEIKALGGLPEVGPDEEAELRALVLGPTRVDFQMAEAHRIASDARLSSPLVLLAGAQDRLAPPSAMSGWRAHSSAGAAEYAFEGGHFFTETHRDAVISTIVDASYGALAKRPRSICQGPKEPAPIERGLDQHFEAQAAKTPDATALVGRDRTLTYAQLDLEADLLADELIARGAGRDRLIALYLETSADFMVGYLAALKAGGGYLQLDLRSPEKALSAALDRAEPIAILTRPEHVEKLPAQWRTCAVPLGEGWADGLRNAGRRPPPRSRPRSAGQDIAYAVMTSGTTGEPKAILCPHQGAVVSYWWRYRHLPYASGEREGCNVFLVWEALRPLLQGAECRLIPDDVIYDPPRLTDYLSEHRVTRMLFTPSLFEQFLSDAEDLAKRLPDLKLIVLNGEVVTSALLERARARLPQARIVNDYSISETHDVAHIDLSAEPPAQGARYAPAGRAQSGVSIYALDAQALEEGRFEPTPWGVAGEIFIGGPTIARGYLGNDEETRARFVTDPFAPEFGARMFRTGDMGRLTETGALEISGRAKFMLKLRGYSVVPSAIEAAAAAHPDIAAAAIVPILDPDTAQPEALVLYAAASAGADIDPDALRAHLSGAVPHYAVPSVIEILNALPIDQRTGKLDRKRLPKPVFQRRSAPIEASVGAGAQPQLAALWSEVLGRAPSHPSDNFFDLGGHSLAAARLARRISDAFGRQLRVVDLFDAPTLAAQAALLDDAPQPTTAPAAPREASTPSRDVAIVSLSGRFPGAQSVEALWSNLLDGRSSIRELTDEELDAAGAPYQRKDYVRAAAIVENADQFDPRFFGLSDREAELIDPQHRLFLECAREALEAGGHAPNSKQQIGVFAGCYLPTYLLHALGGAAALDPHDPTAFHLAEIGNDKDYLATRVAYLLGLSGPALSVQTSCSTGLVAIAEAVHALRAGRCELALAGAASLTFPRTGYVQIDGHLTSASGVGRAFDANADGAILGEGVGVALLKPLQRALRDGDPVLAVIKGVGVNNDGAAKASYSAPSVSAQAEVVSMAMDDAGVSADTISYVEAHGTGTQVGDPIEVAALTRAFRRHTNEKGFCALGSIKPNIGHANIAAGVAGLAKTAMALAHRRQPPMIRYSRPNQELRLEESPFQIFTAPREWPEGDAPRRAGVSSFGIGGTNCHVILEEPPRRSQRDDAPDAPQLFTLSAKSEAALERLGEAVATRLDESSAPAIDDASHTVRTGREELPVRAAFVARTSSDVRAACAEMRPRRANLFSGSVWMFPGNGAQRPMMGANLYARYAAYRARFDECRDVFGDLKLADVARLYDESESGALLKSAAGAQSALFSVELAQSALLDSIGCRPGAVVGHSLGEYAAAVVAGVLSLEDGARLVASRAEATDRAPEGGMLALSCDEQTIQTIAARTGLSVAARNAPEDWTLSGEIDQISAAEKIASEQGVAARRLDVRRAFHSPLMTNAAATLEGSAAGVEMRSPSIPLVSTLTGAWFGAEQANDRTYWARQMRETVRFADALRCALISGPSAVLEVGPGPSLAGLSLKNGGPAALRTQSRASDPHGDDWAFLTAAARLWELGAPLDLAAIRPDGRALQRVVMPTTPFDRRRIWPSAPAQPKPARRLIEFTRATWARATAPAPRAAPGKWLAIQDRGFSPSSLAAQLLSGLRAAGAEVCFLGDDAHELASALRAQPDARVLDVTGLDIGKDAEALPSCARLTERLKAVAGSSSSRIYWRIGAGALGVGLEEVRPASAAALGPLLVSAQETAALGVRHIDVSPGDLPRDCSTLCEAILDELLSVKPRREPFVALRGGCAWVERFENDRPDKADAQSADMLKRGAHLITGGLGRIGLALAERLAERGASMVLTTRQQVPPSERWEEASDAFARLARLRARGAELRVEQLDVADPGQMRRVLMRIAEGDAEIGGVFHAAGLADLKYLSETTENTLAAEFRSKVDGLHALNGALRDLSERGAPAPRFVLLFSSLAATLGGLGMAGYMAANRYMDAFVDAHVDKSTRWLSINWDDWAFDYDKEQVAAYARSRAVSAMPPSHALDALEQALGDPTLRRIIVSSSSVDDRVRKWLGDASWIADPANAATSRGSDVADSSSPWRNATETAVAAAYREVLGAEQLGPNDDFFDLGGDSLMATRIVMTLGDKLDGGSRPRIADVFDCPTVRLLAERLSAGS